jgi:carbonic anhydrase
MKSHEKLLLENKAWAEEIKHREPDYFERLAADQKPEFLWIGCSDSRVPGDIIVNAQPGEIFVQRNIANQIIATDFNCLSVIQYAVHVIKVQHIIVCGHYNCGGVKAALSPQNPDLPMVNNWLMQLKDTYHLHRQVVDQHEGLLARANRLVELNVVTQVWRIAQLSIIQSAWKNHQSPMLHGWVYALDDGILHQLISLPVNSDVDLVYQQSIAK